MPSVADSSRRAVLLALAAAPLAGCAFGPDDAPPPPTPPPLDRYALAVGDRLSVRVLGQPGFAVEADIFEDGRIEVPFVGGVPAAGRSVVELRDDLTRRVNRDFVIDPQVSVEVLRYRPFFVLGQVNAPGRFDFAPGLDAREAVAMAGGFTRRAETGSVFLIRRIDGRPAELEVSLDTRLFPGDTLRVERRWF
jgi:protein involved in polysaccharide export with SLBB domain